MISQYPLGNESKFDISRGVVTGKTVFRKFGTNAAIGTTETYIGDIGGTSPYMPTTAQSIEFVSSSAADALNGAGMRSITIIGLDANWSEQTVTVSAHATNGTIAVAVSGTWMRVYRCYVESTGTYRGNNVGAITVRVAGGGPSFIGIFAAKGQSRNSGYCVPAGYTLYIDTIHFNSLSSKPVSATVYQAPNANDVTTSFGGAKRVVQDYPGIEGEAAFLYRYMLKFKEYTDLWVTGVVTAGTGLISVEYVGVLTKN